jgi:hypothetical protein
MAVGYIATTLPQFETHSPLERALTGLYSCARHWPTCRACAMRRWLARLRQRQTMAGIGYAPDHLSALLMEAIFIDVAGQRCSKCNSTIEVCETNAA